MIVRRFAATLFLVLSAATATADAMTAVELSPITHRAASLVILDQNGEERTYSPAMIEEFQTYSLTTTTPWRDVPARFEGVLLSDLLAAHGLDTAETIRVTAENDYATTFSRELIENVDIMVATRVDGAPHTRRERGPIQFVIAADAFAASDLTAESNLVWMAARIEAEN
ncbi:MAG: hypothetical protein AAGL89_04400 [Pseudomonadota bacterium]